jgi:hypothetical protein
LDKEPRREEPNQLWLGYLQLVLYLGGLHPVEWRSTWLLPDCRMLIMPTYIRVADGARGLRVTATSYADRAQLVRVWAVQRPHGSKRVAEFQPFELRPSLHEAVRRHVLPIGEWSYWLAVLAFHHGGSAWERSASRHTGPFDVPQFGLAFDLGDAAPETSVTAGDNAMVLSVLYD